ncbi:MAG TPA: SDR family NAD(P)-dependent oxidoreductase [Syntrophorhabdaceae bacterium]|jgi:3-oxoacyl-[acyl-carrier protein] reductase
MNFIDLSGRVALITGAGKGIGEAIAERFVEARAAVALVSLHGAREATERLKSKGADVEAFACDVSDPKAVRETVDAVLKRFDHIDILVNNAGVGGEIAPVWEVSDEEWNRVISTDLSGVFYCCRAIVPHMRSRGWGRIITVASVAGKEGNPNMAPYSAAKAGVIGFTKSLGKEVAKDNITVNVITPGVIKTGLVNELTPEQAKYLIERIPMGRIGKAEEVAAMVHWLASDDATFSTGAVFDLSGGRATY